MEIQKIKIEKISASPLNPRKTFDEVAIEELAANIEKQGLLQPDRTFIISPLVGGCFI